MKLVTVLGLGALALAGCAHAPSAPEAPAAHARDYYPLAVGNHWSYQTQMLGSDRPLEIAILRTADGYFVDNQGAQLTYDADGLRDDRRYLLKDPIKTGTEWDNVVSVSAREHYRITQADAPCDAPAGHFEHCVTVESQNRTAEVTLHNTLTFARGVGLVRLSVTAEAQGNTIPQTEYALSSYVLQQASAPAPTH